MFTATQMPYYILMLALFMAMWPSRKARLSALAIFCFALLSAYSSHLVSLVGLSVVLVFALISKISAESVHFRKGQILLGVWIVMAFFMAGHRWPGFHNLLILDQVTFTKNALPYTMYFNFDKPLIGFFFLFYLSHFQEKGMRIQYQAKYIAMGALVIPVLMAAGIASNYVEWEPKWIGNVFVIWALKNLFFTCLAEEALFRGVIWKALQRFSALEDRGMVVLGITAVLFGLAHFAGGASYVALSMVAGLGYGWVRMRTGSILASSALHWFVNTIHLLFFTYPALQAAS